MQLEEASSMELYLAPSPHLQPPSARGDKAPSLSDILTVMSSNPSSQNKISALRDFSVKEWNLAPRLRSLQRMLEHKRKEKEGFHNSCPLDTETLSNNLGHELWLRFVWAVPL